MFAPATPNVTRAFASPDKSQFAEADRTAEPSSNPVSIKGLRESLTYTVSRAENSLSFETKKADTNTQDNPTLQRGDNHFESERHVLQMQDERVRDIAHQDAKRNDDRKSTELSQSRQFQEAHAAYQKMNGQAREESQARYRAQELGLHINAFA